MSIECLEDFFLFVAEHFVQSVCLRGNGEDTCKGRDVLESLCHKQFWIALFLLDSEDLKSFNAVDHTMLSSSCVVNVQYDQIVLMLGFVQWYTKETHYISCFSPKTWNKVTIGSR